MTMKLSTLHILVAFIGVLPASFLLGADALPDNLAEGTLFLSANSKSIGIASLPVVHGQLASHEGAEAITSSRDILVLNADSYRQTAAILRYPLESPILPGEYVVWTLFTQGGDSSQTFDIALGNEGPETRITFSQAAKSGETKWRKAPGSLTIYPDDDSLEITISGKAMHKTLGGFLLEPVGKLPAAMDGKNADLRRIVSKRYKNVEPTPKLLLLEGLNASDLDSVFKSLAGALETSEYPSVIIVNPEKAAALNAKLGLSNSPRVVLLDQFQSIRKIWEAPFPKEGSEFLAAIKDDISPLVLPSVAPQEDTKLEDGRPLAWLSTDVWAGPAGLSLWGLGYEAIIRPNPGDPYLVSRFDTSLQRSWKSAARNPDQSYLGDPLGLDCIWSKGAIYAHLYVHSDMDVDAVLHLAQSGIVTNGWLNGESLSFKPDWSPQAERLVALSRAEGTGEDKTDQGASMTLHREPSESPRRASLALRKGWNRILVKFVVQQKKAEPFVFTSRFTSEDGSPLLGLRTALADPSPSMVHRATAARIIPLLSTNAPFNMAYEGEPLALTAELGSANYSFRSPRSGPFRRSNEPESGTIDPYFPFDGTLELVVTDYDGKEIARRSMAGRFPGTLTFDLGAAPARGYYATQLHLYDRDHHLITSYPPDGFSVIGGTAAQVARKNDKKMAVVYYFMAGRDRYKTLYFPYMHHIGILRNIGGHNERNVDIYRTAAEEGLLLSADLWNHGNQEYVDMYAKETAPYVDSFKSFNEIDIVPAQRRTPESWVEKSRLHYEAAKKYSPKSIVLGGSFARPAADSWFEECLKLGLDKYHDVWDVHCYPQLPPVLEGTMSNSPNETELGVLTAMKKIGMTNTKPFWIGETGARASHGFDARRWQAETVAKMVACTLSRLDFEKIGFLVPWDYAREYCSIGDIGVAHMPAEAAYYTASALVDGFPYEKLSFGRVCEVAQFGPTTMAWSTADTSREISFKPKGKAPFVLVDVVGRTKPLTVDENGHVTLSLTQSPVYVLSRVEYDRLTAFSK
jgi:hypothetical protein